MTFTLGMVGAGQFSSHFATLFDKHPGISAVYATDVVAGRAEQLVADLALAGTFDDFDAMLASDDIDAVAIFTQRWTHGPLAVKALRAGKHVYSAVPMAISEDEICDILRAVEETGLVYMMGETSQYNPATLFARRKFDDGAFGRVFYAEGDYVHDMDLGFYDAYKYSGGDEWKATASYPPMLYPTHAIGGVLGAIPRHAVSVSCIGVRDDRGDGVFDESVSMFDNDFSNMTALFELDGGGSMRINEFRRVGYPSYIRESRFRWFGTDGSFEQLVGQSVWQDRDGVCDVSDQIESSATMADDDPRLSEVSPTLRAAFTSGHAPVHTPLLDRLPDEYAGASNGHEGSHQLLADDFVRAVADRTLPPVNAWQAARYTLPGVIALQSARRGGERLPIPDAGDPPVAVGVPLAPTLPR